MGAPFFDNCATAEDHSTHSHIKCANCGASLFETDPLISEMEGQIIWSHLEDTKCDDPEPLEDNNSATIT